MLSKRSFFQACALLGTAVVVSVCSDNSSVAPNPKIGPAIAKPAFDFSDPSNGLGQCMGDDGARAKALDNQWIDGSLGSPPSYNCTANDVSVTQDSIATYQFLNADGTFTSEQPWTGQISCTPGQTVRVRIVSNIQNSSNSTNQQRFDVGIWIANPISASAMNGSCTHYNLIPGQGNASSLDPPPGVGDACGDINTGNVTIHVPLGQLTFVCPAGQPTVTMNSCLAWANSDLTSARGSCPTTSIGSPPVTPTTADGFRFGTLPENGAKCNCQTLPIGVDVRGRITIIKNAVGGNGSFDYTSDIGSNSIPAEGAGFTINTAVSTTHVIDQVKAGTYHITESNVPSDFDFTSLACTPTNAFASATISSTQATIVLQPGGIISCTYTNTKKSSLTIQKQVVGAGSTFSFTGTGAGVPASFTRAPSANSTTTDAAFSITDVSDVKYVQETVPAGYALTGISCTANGATIVIGRGGSGAFLNGGSDTFDAGDNTVKVTMTPGNTPTCTFTNTQNASLTIQKTVVGTGTTFNFTGSGTDIPSSFSRTPATNGTTSDAAFAISGSNLGIKYVQETVPAGYTLTNIACTANNATVVIGRGGSGAFTNGGTDGFDAGDNTVKVTVAAGNTPTCTFTNTLNSATLAIQKSTVGGTGSFDFVTTGNGLSNFSRNTATQGNPTTVTATTLTGTDASGDKYIQETVPAGWTLTNIVCTAGGATVVIGRGGSGAFTNGGTDGFDAGDNTVKVTIGNGNSPSCTFTNTLNSATIAVQKSSVGGTGSFDYTVSGNGLSAFSRNTATQGNPTNVSAISLTGTDASGDKYVTETVPSGWTLTNIVCTANGATIAIGTGQGGSFNQGSTSGYDSGDNTVKITLANGNSPTCTFTNTLNSATVAIQKSTVGGTGSFDFVTTGNGLSNFSRNTASQGNPTNVTATTLTGTDASGDKYVQETVPAGWTLTNIVCTAGGATIVIGRGGSGAFATGGTNGFDAGDNTVKITVASGNTPSCTFTNTLNSSTLAIQKATSGGTGSFDYTVSGTGLSAFSRNTATQGNPTTATATTFTGTDAAGDKYVTETVPDGWRLTNIVCTANGATILIGTGQGGSFSQGATSGFDAGDNTVKVTVANGNSPTCTFTNTLNSATLAIQKVTVGGTGLFNYVATGTGISNFSRTTSAQATPTSVAPMTFTGTDASGDKYVQETVPSHWALTNIVCTANGATIVIGRGGSGAFTDGGTSGFDAGDNTVKVTEANGNSPTCTFTNTKLPTLTVIKYLKGDVSDFGFTSTGGLTPSSFTLTPNGTNCTPAPGAGNTCASTTFSDLTVGGTYTVTEDSKTGYLLTDLNCTLHPGTYDPASTRTVSTTLAAGEDETCTFTNEQQQGGSTTRTQGFWAAHSSITNAVWFGGDIGGVHFDPMSASDRQICIDPNPHDLTLTTLGQVLGGFWAGISQTSGNKKRTDLNQARMQLLQQLLAAISNHAAFGSSPSGSVSIAQAKAAFCGIDIDAIKAAQSAMAAFNTSGDNGVFTPGASANGKLAKTLADIPFWDTLIP